MLSYNSIDAIINMLKQNASALQALQSAAQPIPQLQSAISYLASTQHNSAVTLEAFLKGDYHRVTQSLLGLGALDFYSLANQKAEFFAVLKEHVRYLNPVPQTNQFVSVKQDGGSYYLTVTLEPDGQPMTGERGNAIQIPSPTIELRLSGRDYYDARIYTPVHHPFTGDYIELALCTTSDSELNFMLEQVQRSLSMPVYESLEFYVTSISKLLYEYEQLLYKNRAFQIHGKDDRKKPTISQLNMIDRSIAVSYEPDSISGFLSKQGDAFITVDDATSYGILDSGYTWGLLMDGSLVLNHQFNKYIDYRYTVSEENKKSHRVSYPFGSRNNNTDLRPFYNPIRFLEQMFSDETPTEIRVLLNDNSEVHPWSRTLDMVSFVPLQVYTPKDVVKLHLMRLELIKRVSQQYLKNKSMEGVSDV